MSTTDPLDELARDAAGRFALDPEDFARRVRRQLVRRQARGERPFKPCPVCRKDLPALAFAEDASKPDGLKVVCRACMADREARRRACPNPGA